MSASRPIPAPGGIAATLDRVTVLIVNYNAGGWLEQCVGELRRTDPERPAIVLVDNGSTDSSTAFAASVPNLRLDAAGANLGFGPGINRAARGVDTDYLLLLNPDCLIAPVELERLVRELDAHPGAAMAGGRVFDIEGREQRASRRRLPTPQRVLREVLPFSIGDGVDLTARPAPQSADWAEAVSGACMLIRRCAFEAVGGFDPGFAMHFEDLDLMARLQEAGWRLRLVPEVRVTHAGGVSSRHRPVAVLWSKHRGLWRYLSRHCRDRWPAWQRPLWVLLLVLHGLVMTPVVWLRRR